MSNVHEERARAAKAYKLSRVALRLLDDNPAVTIEDLRAAGPEIRGRMAVVAGVWTPSDATWEVMIRLVEEQRR